MLLQVRLRVVSIELLCAAMPSEHLKSPPHAELRGRMIACFFKSLTVRSDEVVAVARDALAYVIDAMKEKLQKELLQSSLRPILLNLADYRKLSVPLLQGLSRLLSLLSNFFNLTLGEKLLEHLRRWTDPDTVNKAKAFKPGDEVKIPGAILSLFHLLPPAPNKFLDQLVTVTMDLDASLPGSAAGGRFWSQYREALLPYINRHAPEAVSYFLDRLTDTRFFRMLLSYTKCADAGPVRAELANNATKLLMYSFEPERAAAAAAADAARAAAAASGPGIQPPATPPPLQISPAKAAELRVQGIVLVHALVKRVPGWLSSYPAVLSKLIDLWVSPERKQRLSQEEQTPLEQLGESKLLVKCFVTYCRYHAQPGKPLGERQVEILFLMLPIFSEHSLINYAFLKAFYLQEVATTYEPKHKAAIVRHFLAFFAQPLTPAEDKVHALQLLVLPVLSASFAKGAAREVLAPDIVTAVINTLLGGEQLPSYDEPLRIELLKLATLLIEHAPEQLVEHRKELIKFAWNHLKSDDTQSKQCAYVNVCRFIQVYDTPPKIILQVYVALLRTFQPDARTLVKQALDILTPALPKRLPAGDHKYPTWIKWTKKIIVEEGHSLPQLIHIWQLVVRHPALFYSSSAQFVPQMVNSLNRIGLSPNCSVENRRLAVELAALIIAWEHQRCSSVKQPPIGTLLSASSGTTTGTVTGTGAGAVSAPPPEAGMKRTADGVSTGGDEKRIKTEGGAAPPPATAASGACVTTTSATTSAAGLSDSAPSAAGAPASACQAAAPAAAPPASAAPSVASTVAAVPAVAPALAAQPVAAPAASGSVAPAAAEVRGDEDFKPSAAIVEVLINFLIRVALIAADGKDAATHVLSEQCIGLLESGLTVWTDANIKLTHFEKQLNSAQDSLSALLTGIGILQTILVKQPSFVLRSLPQLQILLRPAFESYLDSPKMVAALTSFVTSALPALNAAAAAAPAGSTAVDDVASFIKYLSDTTAAGLQSTRETTFIGGYVQLLGALSRVEPKLFSEHVAPLSKLLQRLVRDPAATRATAGASAGQSGTANREGADGASSREPDMPLKTLKLVVELVCAYASSHTDDVDARRGFAIPLIQLIDPKVDHDLLLKVTKLITPWLTAPLSQTTMTVKERAQFVMKMTVFESVPYPPLQAAFLDIVYKMYTDAQLARRELLDKIEPAFMFGLRARDVSLRSSFYDIFHRSVGRTPYHRLHFLVQTQDADALASTTWLRHALQLLLATAELDASIVLPSSGPQLPTLLLKPAPTTSTGDAPASASATSWHAVLKAHTSFLSSCASCGTNGELLATLAELLHDEKAVPIMYGLWVSLLPQVWAQLSSTEQEQMVKPIVTVLSKESPHRQSSSKPNTVQAWLHALSACKPMPKLPASLLKYLARAYGAWHLVWPMLQHQALHFPTEPQWYDALSELSSQLHDRDLYCALWAKRAAHPETRRALALEQYGAWHAAQAAYVECMHRWQSGDVALINTPRAELMQWEHGLIRAAKNLNQWELLTEFAKSMPAAQPTLLMECLWKIGDWERLKDLFAKYSLPEQPRIKMLQTYAAIHEGKLPDAEQRCNEGIQAALLQWTSLPSLDAATHTPLLHIWRLHP